MEMTLRVMGIGAGDEVITTAYTYTATCSCICHVGAVPVLVDTLPGSYEMDPEKAAEAVTERTKAIICEMCIRDRCNRSVSLCCHFRTGQ